MTPTSKLKITLPSDRELLMTRMFDAPPALVFETFTRAELVPRWWCCSNDGFTMPVCTIDLRVGGAFRFVTRSPDGTEFPLVGVYREVSAPSRLVHTQRYDVEPYARMESLVTLTFEADGERTRFASLAHYPSVEARDGHLSSGMERGSSEGFDRLEAIARSLAPVPRLASVR